MTGENINYINDIRYPKKALVQYIYNDNNFNKIPPIVGILFADLFGNAIMTYEYDEHSNYGTIRSYLSDDKNSLLEIDLVSMYFSSFKIFAKNNNIKDLSYLEIHGSNLKIQISFLFEKFMIIIFLNSNTILSLKTQKKILNHFKDIIEEYGFFLEDFNKENSRNIIRELKKRGCDWVKKLNKTYIQDFKLGYLKKSEYINSFISRINPIIQKELKEYLEIIPDDILNDISREIRYKIHNEVFELASELFKK